MTELRDCFDVLPDRHTIRLKGTRIDWEHVVQAYQNGMPPEEIAATAFGYPLPVEQVYAAITHYLLNKAVYEEYVRRGDEIARELSERYWAGLTPEQRDRQTAMLERLKELKAKFTDGNGRLDAAALRAHLMEARSQPVGVGP